MGALDDLSGVKTEQGSGGGGRRQPDLSVRFKQFAKGVQRSPVMKALGEFSQLPAEGVNALLGAPQRVVASRIANFRSNPKGVAGTTAGMLLGPSVLLNPDVRKQAGNEVYSVFHPNDPSIEAGAEQATGVNRLMSKDPRFRGKLQNFAVRTGFETLTDPLTFATGGVGKAGEMGLQALGRAGTHAMREGGEGVSNLLQHTLTNVPERLGGYSPKEVSTINTLRQRGITQSRVQKTADEQLLHAHAAEIRKGVIPMEIRQRLLREPYVYGTPEMREQAVQFGYIPSAAEKAKKPEGILNYNLRENYDPATGMVKHPLTEQESLLIGEERKAKAPRAGFEEQQTLTPTPENLRERLEQRLAIGRAVISHRGVSQGLQEHLGASKEMADSMARKVRFGGVTALKSLSKAQVDALLATGVPHMRNVGVAGYLAMGEKGMARAAQFFATGVPKELRARLEEGGASHFGVRVPGKYSPAKLLDVVAPGFRGATTRGLDKWDNAVRAARLEMLDKDMKGASEFEKLDRVNQDIGAYNQTPWYVSTLKGLGANFPQWHSYIVPTMVGRAALRNPERIERLARTEQNANDSFLKNKPYRITLGGPVDEAASAAADPVRAIQGKGAKYFLSPSSVGPFVSGILPSAASGVPVVQRAAEYAAGFVPFGPQILDATLNPYNNKAPALGRAGLGIAGLYEQKRTPGSMRRTQEKRATSQAPSALDKLANP